MDLGLETIRTRGRATVNTGVAYVRDIVGEDLAMLDVSRASTAPAIKRLSERHHSLARTIASGTPIGDAAIICGYDLSRVSILQSDPTFAELVAFYRKDFQLQYADLHTNLAGLASDAVDELRDRLENTPETIKTTELIDIVAKTADRTGYGPQSSSVNVNVHVNLADKLKAARERAREAARTIDIVPREAAE